MKRSLQLVRIVATTVICLCASTALVAQEPAQPEPELLAVNVVQVKPETSEQFFDIHREVWTPAAKKAGYPWKAVWTTVFGDTFDVYVTLPIENYAQFDQPDPTIQVLTPLGTQMAAELWSHSVNGRQAVILQTRPDLSVPSLKVPRLARAAKISVVGGKAPEFEELIKSELVPAYKEAGAEGYYVFKVVWGGDMSEYWTLSYMDSWAELDGPMPLARARGPAGATEVMMKFVPLVARWERSILQFDPELSYGFEMEEAE